MRSGFSAQTLDVLLMARRKNISQKLMAIRSTTEMLQINDVKMGRTNEAENAENRKLPLMQECKSGAWTDACASRRK